MMRELAVGLETLAAGVRLRLADRWRLIEVDGEAEALEPASLSGLDGRHAHGAVNRFRRARNRVGFGGRRILPGGSALGAFGFHLPRRESGKAVPLVRQTGSGAVRARWYWGVYFRRRRFQGHGLPVSAQSINHACNHMADRPIAISTSGFFIAKFLNDFSRTRRGASRACEAGHVQVHDGIMFLLIRVIDVADAAEALAQRLGREAVALQLREQFLEVFANRGLLFLKAKPALIAGAQHVVGDGKRLPAVVSCPGHQAA